MYPHTACVRWGLEAAPWQVGLSPSPGPQGKQLRALQPYVLSCCYSMDGSVVAETFQVLRDLVDQLPWQHSAAFLIQLTFTLAPFLEEVRAPRPVSLLGRLPVMGWPKLSQRPSGQTATPAMGLTATVPGLWLVQRAGGSRSGVMMPGGPADSGGLRAAVWEALACVHVCVLSRRPSICV